MAKNVVVNSYNLDGETRCVDIFRRPDGTFGFQEFRRDAEDGRGWFAVASYAEQTFASADEALAKAKQLVGWLSTAAP